MRALPAVLLVVTWAAAAGADGADTCVECHRDLEDELGQPVALMDQDIHSRQGLSCVDCHGGDRGSDDEDESMSEDAGFVGVPARKDVPRFCGRCHSDATFIRQYNPALRVDQETLYHSSFHGQRLAVGDKKVAVCTDCHHAHGILPAADPRSPVYAANVPATCGHCHGNADYMAEYGIPTDQLAKYSTSVHGRPLLEQGDLSAPACNDCHGNHGATPPGVKSLANVCGQCHPINSELVNESPHKPAFEKLGIAACTTCHSHHDIQRPTDDMVGNNPSAVCARCHSPEQRRLTIQAAHNGLVTLEHLARGWEGAAAIRGALDSLRVACAAADSVVRSAERAGMEMGDALYDLNEAAGRLTRARSTLHSFDPARVGQVADEGRSLAAKALKEGHEAHAELAFRRKGLALSLLVIAIVGAALYARIRTLDR